jgi:hypothetical protein
MTSPPSRSSPQHRTTARAGHRSLLHPGNGRAASSSRASAGAPDLAAAAADAVVRFLHESSVAVAERDDSGPAGAGTDSMAAATTGAGDSGPDGIGDADGFFAAAEESMAWSAASAASQLNAESVALRAAAVSVSTLDRIELMAAKLEADIASAHRAQAELQAGAGAAAEAAVRAAQDAWVAAGTAVEADKQAKISLLKVARYVEVTFALLIVAMVVLIVSATAVH